MSKIYPYAGFWRRAVAFLIDSLVIGIVSCVLFAVVFGLQFVKLLGQQNQQADPKDVLLVMGSMFLLQVLLFVFFWLYFALQESGKAQATLGKRAMGIKVVGPNGERIGFWRATGRVFAKMVSNMTLYFGYYMAGFTKKRQALHDLMATTYVVQDSFQAGDETPELAFSVGGLIASILAAVLPVVFFFLLMVIGVIVAAAGAETDTNMDTLRLRNKAVMAQTQMFLMSMEENKPALPKEENGITYSKTKDGYQADFSDGNGNAFTLKAKEGAYDACCAQGDCAAIDTEPCR